MNDQEAHGESKPKDYFSSSVMNWASELSPDDRAEVGRIARDSPDDPQAKQAWEAVRMVQRKEHHDRTARDPSFTPENHQGARGLWGLRGALPTWMGGDTINWEEPPKHPNESPEDYALRSDEEYAKAYDLAKAHDTPIRRMATDRDSLAGMVHRATPYWMGGEAAPMGAKDMVGTAMGAASGVPGLHGIVRGAASETADMLETAKNVLHGGPSGAVAGLLKENTWGNKTSNYLQEAEEGVPILGRAAGLASSSLLPLGKLGTIGGAGAKATIARNAALAAGSSAISSGTEALADSMSGLPPDHTTLRQGLESAGEAAGLSVPLSLFGLAGKGLSGLVRGGALKGDIENLEKAGGKTSLLEGFKFPPVVESAIAKNANFPAPEVGVMERDPVIQKLMSDHVKPMEELGAKNLEFMRSPEGKQRIRPTEYANALYDTARRLADVPGAPTAQLGKLSRKVFEPISFKNGTLFREGDDSAILGMKMGERTVTAEEAQKLGLQIDTSVPDVSPRHADMTIPTAPEAGGSVDTSRLRVILRPKEMDAQRLHDTARYAKEIADVASGIEGRSETAKDMHPLMKGLFEARDRFGYNEHAPESMTATLRNGKVVKGWSALNQLESQEIERFKDQLKTLGATPRSDIQSKELAEPIRDAIAGFRQGNPDRDAVLEAILANSPNGTKPLYAAPVAQRAKQMKAKASILGNMPVMGSSAISLKPFIRAVGIHADPVLRGLQRRGAASSVYAGSHDSVADLMQLQQLSDQLEEEQRKQANE